MVDVVWAILRQNNRFLLAQQSLTDSDGETWVFPGGEKDRTDPNDIAAVYRELNEEVGLKGKRFRKLLCLHSHKYRIQIFLCDQWCGELKPACEDIIGVGWFTWEEMHLLDKNLSPFINDHLLFLSYLIQHYDNNPDEWLEQWKNVI